MKYAINSVPGFADTGVPHGDGGGPQNSTQMSRGIRIKFLVAIITMPNSISSLKYALMSVPGLADVWAPHGIGDGPRSPTRCPRGGGVRKRF